MFKIQGRTSLNSKQRQAGQERRKELRVKLLAHPVKTGQARLGLPGNVDMITGSTLTPLRESVTALPASR